MSAWTSPADVLARAKRSWENGSLLSAYVSGSPSPVLEVRVRGPAPREVGADLENARRWRAALVAGSRDGSAYTLIERPIGGRVIGHLTLPDRVVVSAYPQWWRILGVADEVRSFDEVVEATRGAQPELLPWITRRPLVALDVAPLWDRLLASVRWLAPNAGAGRYVREVTAAGVDTKFIEQHRRVLGEWLDLLVPERVDHRFSTGSGFARRYGFAEPERLVRMRCGQGLGVVGQTAELGLRVADAARLDIEPADVLIIENQVTYLAVPPPDRGVVLWGHGFDAGRLGQLAWLDQAERVRYWGDLDTHGFAILNLLRSQVPGVQSVLMDRATLLEHRERWVAETRPTRADLTALTDVERVLYDDLVSDAYGPAVRLEQERVDWAWASAALEQATQKATEQTTE